MKKALKAFMKWIKKPKENDSRFVLSEAMLPEGGTMRQRWNSKYCLQSKLWIEPLLKGPKL